MSVYDYIFKKVDKFASGNKRRGRVWTDEVVDGFRCIYIRCAGCIRIFELGSAPGTVKYELTIGKDGTIYPCIICPHCDTHIFARLDGYEKIEAPDFFSPDQKRGL